MTLLLLLLVSCFFDGVAELLAKLVAFLLVLPIAIIGLMFILAKLLIGLFFVFSDSSSLPEEGNKEKNIEPDSSGLQLQWVQGQRRG